MSSSQTWEAQAAAKRASTLAKIPPEWRLREEDLKKASQQRDLTGPFIKQYLTNAEIEIIQEDSNTLVNKIKTGDYTAKLVTLAFCKTAAIGHQINNCLHEIFFDQAIARAQELDRVFRDTGTVTGPLHGLPVSIKDQFHVKGIDTTMGYVGWIDTFEGQKDEKLVHNVNSQIVDELLELGAILYCKTSLPQTLLFGETVNNIIGTTLNPQNQNLSCGGSSGGEGALLALKGSPVGLGTDIAGSVRIPSAFNGIYGIKPTHTRLSYRNAANTSPGQTTHASSIGVMSPSLDSIQLILSSILSTKPWLRDPNVTPMPWRQNIVDQTLALVSKDGSATEKSGLKLGVLRNDHVVTPHPPISRGLRFMVDAIKNAGHKVVEWDPPTHHTPVEVHAAFLRADGGSDMDKQLSLSGEPLLPDLHYFKLKEPMSLLTYHALTVKGRDYETAYSDYWNSTCNEDGHLVDAFIMPVAPHAAVVPGKYYYNGYTQAINLLDYTALVIPITKADGSIDIADPQFTALNDLDATNWEAYDPGVYHGAPVAVQVVGRKFEEEKIWAIGKIIHEILQTASIK